MSNWIRVSKHTLCPICQSDSWCTLSDDGAVVKCMRLQSEHPHDKGGWFHFDQPIDIIRAGKPPAKPDPIDAMPIAKACYEAGQKSSICNVLAEYLGVSGDSLDQLKVGVGEDHDGAQWFSFPSRDGDGKIIGITRRYLDGSKKTYRGTSNGIFYAVKWYETPGVILIVEGASDVAAAMTHGLCAIGRSSNVGGIEFIKTQLAKHAAGRPTLVIGEYDEQPDKRGKFPQCTVDCTGCSYCFPGKYGAEHVAKQLGSSWCMPIAPSKDLRAMLSQKSVWVDALRALTYKSP